MFDLDRAIADWRRQLTAGGVKSPAVLDELESHLREEIEQQSRSGLNDAQAFEIAVQRIGRARVLGSEFKKIEGTTIKEPVKCLMAAAVFLWTLYLSIRVISISIPELQAPSDEASRQIAMTVVLLGLLLGISGSCAAFFSLREIKVRKA